MEESKIEAKGGSGGTEGLPLGGIPEDPVIFTAQGPEVEAKGPDVEAKGPEVEAKGPEPNPRVVQLDPAAVAATMTDEEKAALKNEVTAETPLPPPCELCKGKGKVECPVCKDKPNPKCQACKGTKEMDCPACGPGAKPTLIIRFMDTMSIQFSVVAEGPFHPAVMNMQIIAVAEFLKARAMHILEEQFKAQDEEQRTRAGIQQELLRGVKPGMRVPRMPPR